MKIVLNKQAPLEEQISAAFTGKQEKDDSKMLDLSYNALGKRPIKDLLSMVGAIKQHADAIDTVNLSGNALYMLKAELAALLAAFAFKESTIKTLILSTNNLAQNDSKDLMTIADALSKSGIIMLDISNNSLQKLELTELKEFLAHLNTPALKNIKLDDTSLSGLTGADNLAKIFFETFNDKVVFEGNQTSFTKLVGIKYQSLVQGEHPQDSRYTFYQGQNESKPGDKGQPMEPSNRYV